MSLTSMDSPRRHRYSVADYYRMGEAGIFAPDSREELIDGDIFDWAPPTPLHAATVTQLHAVFWRAIGDEASVSVRHPVRLSEFRQFLCAHTPPGRLGFRDRRPVQTQQTGHLAL